MVSSGADGAVIAVPSAEAGGSGDYEGENPPDLIGRRSEKSNVPPSKFKRRDVFVYGCIY